MSSDATTTTRAHASLLSLALALIAANAAVHVILVLAGNRITVLTTLPLLAVTIGMAIYLLTSGRALGRVRYGRFVAHALCYATVNVGYLLHAYLLIGLGSPAIAGDGSGTAIDPTWLGASLGMAGLWGLGLILHGVGAVLDRGFEAPRR